MSDHTHRTIERHCDVAVVGGSAAGLAAALQLCRQRRSVFVIDAGEPRNAPAAHIHGYLGHEGMAPSELTRIGREEVRSFGAEVLTARATDVTRTDDGRFRVALTGGHSVVARRVLAATGLVDELPDIPGIAEQWGRGVIHCPFCHGFEVRDRRLVHIVTHPLGLHPAPLFRHLSSDYTIVLHGDAVDLTNPTVESLRAAGVGVVSADVSRVVIDDNDEVRGVELSDGSLIDAEVVLVGAPFRARAEPFRSLGVRTVAHASGLGDVVEANPMGETSVPGVYAAGNVSDPSLQVLPAAANGSWVGAMIAFSLANEDLPAATRQSGNEVDWDHRYSGEQVWSGNPNGTLVNEIASLAPGRALDVGAGEGGDAIWLAEQGWTVTATDISTRGLSRIASAAEARDLAVDCLHADANTLQPFEPGAFDLVSAQYASIPRTPDHRGVDNVLGAVAPGGTLLVVGHDLEPMRTPIDTHVHSRAFDPDAFVRVSDFAEVLAALDGWTIEIHETRPRPPGASTHHVHDVVLRARRHVAT